MAELLTAGLKAAQDALKAAIAEQVALLDKPMSVDLGYPPQMGERHIWIGGGADGQQEYNISTGLDASDQTFVLMVNILETLAGTHEEILTRFQLAEAAVITAVTTYPFLGGAVSVAQIQGWRLTEGLTEEGKRKQLHLRFELACTRHVGG